MTIAVDHNETFTIAILLLNAFSLQRVIRINQVFTGFPRRSFVCKKWS